ncbi:MAG: histidinol-phosphate transaminase [Clostridia bacterium]|nr:histidinol-phosphate transaminase [Clostridia bacterium]
MSRFLSDARKSLAPYTPGEQPKVMNLIKLNTNESPFPPSPKVIEAVSADAVSKLRLYSDIQTTGLVQAIAERNGLAPAQVITSNGSDEILAFAFQAFGAEGVAFPDITYGFYSVWAELFSCPARIVPLNDDFTVPLESFMTNTHMVVLANPNAPTGLALPLSDIRKLLDANPDQLVVIDEAYADFADESAVSLIPEYENLLVVQTFSKSRQLAGARLGFAMGQECLIADLNRIKFSFNPYNVNSLTQLAGEAAMRDEAYFTSCRDKIIAARGWTEKELISLGFTVLPSKTNFIFAAPNFCGGQEYLSALRERNILVRHWNSERIRDYVRITVGTQEQMETLIQVTKELIK